MKKIYTTFFLLLIFNICLLNSFSQTAPVIQWQNTIGGNMNEQVYSIQQTSDGGYILGGYSESNISGDKSENCLGGWDYWIVKTDSSGNIKWQNTIGGSANDMLSSIQQTVDGGYILGGSSWSNISGDKTENTNGWWDYWIVKTDTVGNIQWQNTIGGNDYDGLFCVQQTADGGYILGGVSSSNISGDKTENSIGMFDYWIVKTDSVGNIQWQNTIGGSDDELQLNSIQQTADGGYILGGCSKSDISGDKTENCNGGYDYWIVKTDSAGNIQWQNTIGGSEWDLLYSIQQTADKGYILNGWSASNISGDKTENSWNNSADYWVVKTDSVGNIQWQNTIGGNDSDFSGTIQQTTSGDYILCGYSYSDISGDKTENNLGSFTTTDYWIVKIDSGGNILWQNTIGGSDGDVLFSIQQTTDSGYILGGWSWSNISGDKTKNCIGGSDYWIIKLAPDTTTSIAQLFQHQLAISISPNPFSDKLNVIVNNKERSEIIFYDIASRKIMQQEFMNSVSLNTEQLARGLYLFEVRDKNGLYKKGKVVKD